MAPRLPGGSALASSASAECGRACPRNVDPSPSATNSSLLLSPPVRAPSVGPEVPRLVNAILRYSLHQVETTIALSGQAGGPRPSPLSATWAFHALSISELPDRPLPIVGVPQGVLPPPPPLNYGHRQPGSERAICPMNLSPRYSERASSGSKHVHGAIPPLTWELGPDHYCGASLVQTPNSRNASCTRLGHPLTTTADRWSNRDVHPPPPVRSQSCLPSSASLPARSDGHLIGLARAHVCICGPLLRHATFIQSQALAGLNPWLDRRGLSESPTILHSHHGPLDICPYRSEAVLPGRSFWRSRLESGR